MPFAIPPITRRSIALPAAGEMVPPGIRRIGAPTMWARGLRGQDVRVAVIDSGVDLHPEFRDRVAVRKDFTGAARPGDDLGHGTHVAGTIAAGDQGRGIVGVAPGCSIWSYRVLNEQGFGQDEWVATGIWAAVADGVQVINLSLGGPAPNPLVRDALLAAKSEGIVVIAAAGNSGPGNDTVAWPARYAQEGLCLAVAAVDTTDAHGLADFSSRGAALGVAAPGVDIVSTIPGGGYESWSGTSMAAPHIAGAAALIMGQYRAWFGEWPPPDFVYRHLALLTEDIGAPGWDPGTGWGLFTFDHQGHGGAPPVEVPVPDPTRSRVVEYHTSDRVRIVDGREVEGAGIVRNIDGRIYGVLRDMASDAGAVEIEWQGPPAGRKKRGFARVVYRIPTMGS